MDASGDLLTMLAAGRGGLAVDKPMATNLVNMWNKVAVDRSCRSRRRGRAGGMIFWRKSIDSYRRLAILGHGTGSIPDPFRRSAEGLTGMAGVASADPHNQTIRRRHPSFDWSARRRFCAIDDASPDVPRPWTGGSGRPRRRDAEHHRLTGQFAPVQLHPWVEIMSSTSSGRRYVLANGSRY